MMNAYLSGLDQLAVTGLAALLNTLWYAAAVVVVTWMVLRYLRQVNAATRYWIWTAILVFLAIIPFLPTIGEHWQAEGGVAGTVTTSVAQIPGVAAATHPLAPVILTVNTTPGSNPWPFWLFAVWVVAAGWQLARLAVSTVIVHRLKVRAEPMTEALPVTLRRRVQVLLSNEAAFPMAAGFLRPAVIIPRDLLDQLEESEKRGVLLHELAHLARYDDWLKLATRALGALLVLHPLAAIVLQRIEREREMACDDFVVSETGSALGYARSLARLHDLRSAKGSRLLSPALFGMKVSLAERIESLLHHGPNFSGRPSAFKLAISSVLLLVLMAAGGLIPDWIAFTQTSQAAQLSSTTASVEPDNRNNKDSVYNRGQGGKLDATSRTLESWMLLAYGVRPDQVEGLPAWAKSRRYTIHATAPPGIDLLPPAQVTRAYREMFQSLLADRFKLIVHRETRILPAYDLAIASGGMKLKPASANGQTRTRPPGFSGCCGLALAGVSIGQVTQVLSRMLGRNVVNKTGLTGRYDLKLTWKPLQGQARIIPTTDEPYNPSMIPAVKQQLGLVLKPTQEPAAILVVDHVEPLMTGQ